MGGGRLFGELALLNDQCRSATVRCLEESRFMVIRRSDFDAVLEEEMVRKGDKKLRFLMDHLPGMRDVAVPKPGAKPTAHASHFFRKATCPRGHPFLQQGDIREYLAHTTTWRLSRPSLGPSLGRFLYIFTIFQTFLGDFTPDRLDSRSLQTP